MDSSLQAESQNQMQKQTGLDPMQNKIIEIQIISIPKIQVQMYPDKRQQKNQMLIYLIIQQISLIKQILTQSIQQQVQTLKQEINKIDNNNNLTNNLKQYYKNFYQQQLFQRLSHQGELNSIPYVKQNIEASNPDVLLYVLKESLLRDQQRELFITSKEYSFGFESIIGAYGQDQSCFKVKNTKLDYDQIVNDNQLLQQHLLRFQQALSNSFNIPIDQIEILGVSKGSFEINFQITGKDIDVIQQEIQNNPNAQKFLNEYCDGKIEYLKYFDKARDDAYKHEEAGKNKSVGVGVTLSSEDFNPKYNTKWNKLKAKEQRGSPQHRYDYYFPIGCYGFGLNVKKYEDNQDWIQMDGNPNEWRIMYHGTNNHFVNTIVKNNLQPGQVNKYANKYCKDEFGNSVKVGKGIYFSNNFNVCIKDGYAPYTQIGNKQFAVIFMSRVNPQKIRQREVMRRKNYFVVNNSDDVRLYRILLHKKQQQIPCLLM